MSETLTALFVQSLTYWFRDQIKTADIKMNLALSSLKKIEKIKQQQN